MKHILVTGGAGFIGSHLVEKLLSLGHLVTSIDNFDPFYASSIKRKNLSNALEYNSFKFVEGDIRDEKVLDGYLRDEYDVIIHLAAKAGVLPSIAQPLDYTITNVIGTQNLLEFAKIRKIKKFIYASSSSVYGVNANTPWTEDDNVLIPISPYAATKVAGELLGKVYSSLYGLQFIALRFFTVYGPRQRPDLAIHKFTKLISESRPVPFYGDGSTSRDYTYIDDIIEGILGAVRYEDSLYEIINLGNNSPISLKKLVGLIEDTVKKKANLKRMPVQQGDVPVTYAQIDKAKKLLNYEPMTSLKQGINLFYEWFQSSIQTV